MAEKGLEVRWEGETREGSLDAEEFMRGKARGDGNMASQEAIDESAWWR